MATGPSQVTKADLDNLDNLENLENLDNLDFSPPLVFFFRVLARAGGHGRS